MSIFLTDWKLQLQRSALNFDVWCVAVCELVVVSCRNALAQEVRHPRLPRRGRIVHRVGIGGSRVKNQDISACGTVAEDR